MSKWTDAKLTALRAYYPDTDTDTLAAALGQSAAALRSKAAALQLRKTPEYLARARARWGKSGAFQPGQVPWNKGLKGWTPPGGERTRFQPGNRPRTWRPIGSLAKQADGIWHIKIREKIPGQTAPNIVPLHAYLWEQAHGPIPPGHVVRFRDGNPNHLDLDNLDLVSRAEHMARNSRHRLPPEIREALTWKSRLTRVINEMEKQLPEESS